MSQSAEQHRSQAPRSVGCAVVTVSDSRTLEDDCSGQMIVELLEGAGHRVVDRRLVSDEPQQIQTTVRELTDMPEVDAVLVTGGTGLAARDQTPEAVEPLFTRHLPGYGELLRMLSYQEIGPAAMLSRATGGLIDQTVTLTMPGSPGAVRLAMENLILPELAHMVHIAQQ